MIRTGIPQLDAYCEAVVYGYEDVCQEVKWAVERHYRDLERWGVGREQAEGEYYFEPKAAKHFVRFFEEQLQHYEGAVAGEPIIFEPWQWFVFGSIFGWLKTERFKGHAIRRFRTGTIIVPKKNGKSIISGGTALYMMDWDEWPGAQCYILAKNRTHAMDLGYRAAENMVEDSEELSEKYKIKKGMADTGIYYAGNKSFYKPITSKPDSEDGRNVHFCGPDETKDWTDFEIYEVMRNGTVNAPNSLFLNTTTAGNNKDSLGYQQQQYGEKVINPNLDVEDETLFFILYGVDEEDKEGDDWWKDPQIWKKANPNYGVSVFEDALKGMIPEASQSINKQIAFETKHLNVWHSSTEAFIKPEKWAACGTKKTKPTITNFEWLLEKIQGRTAYGGLDLGAVSDFTAFPFALEPEGDKPWEVYCMFWIPEGTLEERKNKDIIRPWVKKGWIGTTDGDVTDYDYVEEAVKKVCSVVHMKELVYDRYKMNQMVNHLMDEGIEMTPFGQGYVSMAPAVDTLEQLVLEQKIEHFGNPVLSWMNSNVSIKKDPAGNRKFDKEKSQDKIDGIVAIAMALERGMVAEEGVTEWTEFKMI
jgi:phage terminase large subunit-like protein